MLPWRRLLIALALGILATAAIPRGSAVFAPSSLFLYALQFYSDNYATLQYSPPALTTGSGSCAGIAPFTVNVTSAKTTYPATTDANPCGGGNLTNGIYPPTLDLVINFGSTCWDQAVKVFGGRNVRGIGGCFKGVSGANTTFVQCSGASSSYFFEGLYFDNSVTTNQTDVFDCGGYTDQAVGGAVATTTGTTVNGSCTVTVASPTGIAPNQSLTSTSPSNAVQSETRVISIAGSVVTFFPCAPSTAGAATLKFWTIYTPDVYLENNLAVGMHGDTDTQSLHTDFLQIGPVGNIYLDKNTMYSNQHCVFLVPQSGYLNSVNVHRLNCVYWFYEIFNNISSGTYNSTTGAVSLTLTASPTGSNHLTSGDKFTISGMQGTGSFASLNGNWTATSGTGATTINFTAGTGLTLSITGGNLYVNSHDQMVWLHDQTGAVYYGTPSAAPAGEPFAPTNFDRVYAAPPDGACTQSAGALLDFCGLVTYEGTFPNAVQTQAAIRPIEVGGGAFWDINKSLMQVSGGILPGRPPTGDYVTQAEVGIGYKTPSYRQ